MERRSALAWANQRFRARLHKASSWVIELGSGLVTYVLTLTFVPDSLTSKGTLVGGAPWVVAFSIAFGYWVVLLLRAPYVQRNAAWDALAEQEGSTSSLYLVPKLETLTTKIGIERFVVGYLIRVRVTNTSAKGRRYEAKGNWSDTIGSDEANWLACWELSLPDERERSISPQTPAYVHVARIMLAKRWEKLDDPAPYLYEFNNDDGGVVYLCTLCDDFRTVHEPAALDHFKAQHKHVPVWNLSDYARIEPLKPSPAEAYEDWGNGKSFSLIQHQLMVLTVEDLDDDTAPSRMVIGFREGHEEKPEVFEYDLADHEETLSFRRKMEEMRAIKAASDR